MQTFLRRLEILNFLKTQVAAVSTEDIINHLTEGGYIDDQAINRRSTFRLVQRDLSFLLGEEFEPNEFDNEFGLMMEQGQRKSRLWKLDPFQSLNYSFEKMPDYMALALSISQKHLKQVLPQSTQEVLKSVFEKANIKLLKQEKSISPKHYQTLTNAVEFFQRGQQLRPPEFDQYILTEIYNAILNKRRINITYKNKASEKEYELHPFGVVIMLPKLYLIAKKEGDMKKGDEAFRSFLIHKITATTLNRHENQVPDDFKLKHYLEAGHMDVLLNYQDDAFYQLVIKIESSSGSNLLMDLKESPISYDQQIKTLGNELWELSATVRRTVQLRNWLLSLGEQAVVTSPDIIKEDIETYLKKMSEKYQI